MSCTGLFGLATYIVNQRSKEMSIRKVLGASIGHILTVFSKDFVILIGVAFVIGVPLAYFSLSRWLEKFCLSREHWGPGFPTGWGGDNLIGGDHRKLSGT